MPFRIFSFAAICAALIFFLDREEKSGGFERFNRLYIEWLVANSNEQFAAPAITLLRLTDTETSVFESWPPSPLDYAVILRNLERYRPDQVMIAPTLGWRLDDQITTGALRTQLLRTSRVLLGCVLQDNPVAAAAGSRTSNSIPENDPVRFLESVPLPAITGNLSAIPAFTGLLTLPEEEFLPGASIAFTHIDLGPDDSRGALAVPLLARRGGNISDSTKGGDNDKDDTALVVPSFVLRAILLQHDRGVEDLVVRLGDAIDITGTSPPVSIPIDERGYLTVFAGTRESITSLDAGALFLSENPELRDLELRAADEAALESLRTNAVLIGKDHPGARQVPLGNNNNERISRAELLAIAIATIQSRRYVTRAPLEYQYALWAAIFLAGVFFLLRLNHKRARLIGFSLLLFMAVTLFSLALFQSRLMWMAPAIPGALMFAILFLGLVFSENRRPQHPPVDNKSANPGDAQE